MEDGEPIRHGRAAGRVARWRRRALVLVACCAAVTGLGTGVAHASLGDVVGQLLGGSPPPPPPEGSTTAPAPGVGTGKPFAPTSFWNARLPADAPLDALSATYVADLQRQVGQYKAWINTSQWSSPVYTVPAGQPTVRVALDPNVSPRLQSAWERVPIPPGAKPAAGGDRTLVVWQPSSDTMWEFWMAEQRIDGWSARWGGRITNLSQSPGHYVDPTNWGATGTSLPMLGGLIRIDELRAGRIDHALAVALPETRADAYSWPAQRTDGQTPLATAIPQGARFRLDPALDLGTLRLDPMVRQMAEAAQRYGLVVRDTAGSVAFYAEDPTPTGWDPYYGHRGFFGGRYPSELLAQFPWSRLQALRTDLRTQSR